jgi:hypothetical protein
MAEDNHTKSKKAYSTSHKDKLKKHNWHIPVLLNQADNPRYRCSDGAPQD